MPALAHADARFRNLTKENALPTGTVFSILQDTQGYMWLATSTGLERYDGYKFTIFKHKPSDPASLASDFVKALYLDSTGRLWIGTYGGGLDLYLPDTGTFRHYRHTDGDPTTIASDKVFALAGGQGGVLLIGTFDSGLDALDFSTGHIQHFTATNGSGLSDNHINSIFTDSRGDTWLATHHGLDELDLVHGIVRANIIENGPNDNNVIWGVSENPSHDLLVATVHGLHSFTPNKALFDKSPLIPLIPGNAQNSQLLAVFIDSGGNTWIGGAGTGLLMYDNNTHVMRRFKPEPANFDSLSSPNIFDIYQDHGGLIWVATDVGIEVMDPRMLQITYLTPYEVNHTPNSSTNNISGIMEHGDSLLISTAANIYRTSLQQSGVAESPELFAHIDSAKYGVAASIQHYNGSELLVGTNHSYLLEMDQHGRLRKQWYIGEALGSLNVSIRGILATGEDAIYLATFGGGLLKFNPNTAKTQSIAGTSSAGLLKNDIVETLLPIAPERLLAGTFRGLFEINQQNDTSSLISLWKSSAEPVIQALYRDPNGYVWVGTYEGLWRLKFDQFGKLVDKQYFAHASNANNTEVLSIEPDGQGALWLASDNSLVRFNPKTGDSLVLGRDQGMPLLEYYSYTHLRTSNGWLWFGGPEGLVGFNPDTIQPNLRSPSAIINGVTAYREDKPVNMQLSPGRPLELNYRDSIVTFDLTASDFAAPQANNYSYRLLGFQSEWTPSSTAHQITFTNLNPGRYRLEVRAANNWGTWSAAPATLAIVVLPPWWRTWWAYTIYLLLIIGSSIGYVYSLKRKIEREKEISTSLREANEIKSNFVERLETQVRKATHDLRETLQGVNLKNAELEIAQKRATEGEQIKSQFLANMSHELRTPLTGVLGYSKLLTSTHLTSEQKDYVGTIRQSSETLLAIINDTLDHSRLEAGKLLIDEVDFDLLEVIESTLELVAPTAYQKRLELIRVVPPNVPLQLRGDPLRLRQVLTNLLSNAIKFTESGSVSVILRHVSGDDREASIAFTVCDTGIGIPASELPQLFHAYARSRISTRHHVEGTGLGLSICKKLLDLMGGEIQVKSRVGSGTSFDFKLNFKLQKNALPRATLPKKIKVLLYDMQPLSNQAWCACLIRLGAEVENAVDLESAVTMQADAAVMVLTEHELAQLSELKRKLTSALPPMLILAPRIERQALKDLSETLYHRVLSKTAREKTLYLELQSLLQAAVHEGGDATQRQKSAPVAPSADAPLVLIADDNRINRRLLVTMLNHAGFRVAEAANGLELLDLAARGPWDVALLDIHMPGMDGLEAAGRLRTALGDKLPPVIAMSADVMPETRKQLDGVMDDFLVKPFSEQELVDKLRWHLDRHARKKRGELQPS
ncbi:MAG TPA: ATP-binding protein [Gammaproteobacteria bacterium]|nr:ATP-binding protein [Gammaproteobacteria bacterium]